MERLRNILFKITLTALLISPLHNLFAQSDGDNANTVQEEIKRINTQRKLIAGKIDVKLETAVLDSILMLYELYGEDDEEEETSPAEDIYEGIWNTQYVKAYADVAVPDSFSVDLSTFVMPFEGKISSPFGPRRRRFHYGTDIKLQVGDTVVAAFEGKIRVESYQRRGYGNYLVIRHPNGLETVYGHLSKFLVEDGDTVDAGQPIALGGSTGRSTGSHLHFECRFLGNAIDPSDIIDFNNFCTYDDSYVFRKSNINAVSEHNIKYSKFARYASYSRHGHDRSITYHRVKSGDSLSKIAKKYRVSISQICRLNGLKANSSLKVGKVIRCS